MNRINGTNPRQARLLAILTTLDTKRFRAAVAAGEEVTDEQILEAIHYARLKHPDVNRIKKANSRRWLNEHC